jgi:hypothetical protein
MSQYPAMMYPYFYSYYYYPWQYAAHPPAHCHHCGHPGPMCQCAKPLDKMKLPLEIMADATTTTQTSFIGGLEAVSLSLEYLKTGAAPSVKVTITDAGTSTVSDITPIDDGYHVKENFQTVAPGTTVQLDVADCTARLRWCEIICC